MSFFHMTYYVVSGDLAAHLAVVPRPLTGLHMDLRMCGGVARDVLAADVANGNFRHVIDGNAISPSLFVNDPNAFRFFHPVLL